MQMPICNDKIALLAIRICARFQVLAQVRIYILDNYVIPYDRLCKTGGWLPPSIKHFL
jgi:hypothetical protein